MWACLSSLLIFKLKFLVILFNGLGSYFNYYFISSYFSIWPDKLYLFFLIDDSPSGWSLSFSYRSSEWSKSASWFVYCLLILLETPFFSEILLLIDERHFGFSIGTSFRSFISSPKSPISPSSSSVVLLWVTWAN